MEPSRTIRRWLCLSAFIIVLTLPACDFLNGCDSITAAPTFPGEGGPKPTPTANPSQTHLYVADELAPGKVFAYALPIASDSDEPTATLNAGNRPFGLDLDAGGRLYVANTQDNSLFVFLPPIATGLTPSVILSPASGLSDLVVARSSSQLFVGSQGQVAVYALPLTASSTPTFSLTNNVSFPHGIGFDDLGDLWVAEDTGRWEWFAPPFSASSKSTAQYFSYNLKKIIGHAGQLFVSFGAEVDVYDEGTLTLVFVLQLPIGVELAEGEAFDANGNFYVAGGSHVYVYGPPLTAASKPIHTLTTPTGSATNIAIGL
jgi:hypothetical protein